MSGSHAHLWCTRDAGRHALATPRQLGTFEPGTFEPGTFEPSNRRGSPFFNAAPFAAAPTYRAPARPRANRIAPSLADRERPSYRKTARAPGARQCQWL